jgi:hypothetical protein
VCRGCGNPLAGVGNLQDPEPAKPSQMGLYVAIGAAALLAVILIYVLVFKNP